MSHYVRISEELAGGKTQRQLAEEIGKSPIHVNYMNKIHLVHLGVQPDDRPPFNDAYQQVKRPTPRPDEDPAPSRSRLQFN